MAGEARLTASSRLARLCRLEGIAAAEEIAERKRLTAEAICSLAAGNVAGAGGAAIEDETGAEAEDEGDDGNEDPGAAGAGVGEFALGDLCALLGEFDAVALDPAGVKIFDAAAEISGASDAKTGSPQAASAMSSRSKGSLTSASHPGASGLRKSPTTNW